MTYLEAFSMGKRRDDPTTNEDSFVIMPGIGYAVFDGVTDRNGTLYDGMLSGRYASGLMKRATEKFFLKLADLPERGASTDTIYKGPEAFVDYLSDQLQQGYVRHGMLEAARADWKLRAGCTMVAAFNIGTRLEIIAVGDSGIRINGTDTLQILKPLDDVMGIVRRQTWRLFEARGHSPEACDRIAAGVTWPGTANQAPENEAADPETIRQIESRALAECCARFPDVPHNEFMELIRHGIANGQGNFQNVDDRRLGYGGLDGFKVPACHIESRSLDLADIRTMELFSDGYFKPGEKFGVAAWEKAFEEVEKIDPHKLGPYLSTKGTKENVLTDDRTYVGVRLQ